MRKILHCCMAILLVFLCGSGMAFSETESLLHEWLFLISEFAYAPDIPWWCIYLMHGLMFVAFMATGVLIKRLSGKIRNTGGMKEWA